MSKVLSCIVCTDCLDYGEIRSEGYMMHFGYPRVGWPEPDDGCEVCGNGGGQYYSLPVTMVGLARLTVGDSVYDVPSDIIREAERLKEYWETHGDNSVLVNRWAVRDLLAFVQTLTDR